MKDNAIAFIFDKGYLLPTIVAFRSFLDNRNIMRQYNVFFVTDKECAKICMEDFRGEEIENVSIQYVTPEIQYMELSEKITHVSQTALLKFWLPELLPTVDKVLYLDGDILIRGCLDELLDMHFDDEEMVFAAKDMGCSISGHLEEIGLSNYFNSGVMLLNLKKMREKKITEKLIEEKTQEEKYYFMDQDAFNKVLSNNVTYLPLKYNYIVDYDRHYSKNKIMSFYNEDYKDDELVVLHMAGAKKPWTDYGCEQFEEWCSHIKTQCEVTMLIQALHKNDVGYLNSKLFEHEDGYNKHLNNVLNENNANILNKQEAQGHQIEELMQSFGQVQNYQKQQIEELRQVQNYQKQQNEELKSKMEEMMLSLENEIDFVKSRSLWYLLRRDIRRHFKRLKKGDEES